jgi:dolichol-phosphate mannosyltransferase
VQTFYVLIPALDEAANIERVFKDLMATCAGVGQLRVILVDDGSTDGTGDRARIAAHGVDLIVLRHETPQGPGQAFATGFKSIAGTVDEDDFVLTIEADNTSRLEIVELMMRRLEEGYDAVLASPYAYGGGILHTNPFRVGVSHVANAFVKEFLGIHGLLTVSSFFRLYRGSAICRLQTHYGPEIVERAGFECMVELILKMVYLRMSISEIPMVLDSGRRAGPSKMNVVRTAAGYLALFKWKRAWRDAATRER